MAVRKEGGMNVLVFLRQTKRNKGRKKRKERKIKKQRETGGEKILYHAKEKEKRENPDCIDISASALLSVHVSYTVLTYSHTHIPPID